MFKLIFGGIIVLFVVGTAFFVGFVLGSTMTPLADASAAAPQHVAAIALGASHV